LQVNNFSRNNCCPPEEQSELKIGTLGH